MILTEFKDRTVADGKVPSRTKVEDCMTIEAVTIAPDASLEDAAGRMEENKLRRLIVVDVGGRCIGIVVQAQLARNASNEVAGGLLRGISRTSPELSPTRS